MMLDVRDTYAPPAANSTGEGAPTRTDSNDPAPATEAVDDPGSIALTQNSEMSLRDRSAIRTQNSPKRPLAIRTEEVSRVYKVRGEKRARGAAAPGGATTPTAPQ